MKDAQDMPDVQARPEVQLFAAYRGQFRDEGIGYLEIVSQSSENEDEHFIEVRKPLTEELILRSRLQAVCNFERQSQRVITWSDPDRKEANDLAMSFLTRGECNYYWKTICRKLNLDFFMLDGKEKLEKPNEHNISEIINQLIINEELVIHNMIHSQEFKDALWETLDKFERDGDEIGKNHIYSIIKDLLKKQDTQILKVMLQEPNFQYFLRVYSDQCKIDFYSVYQQTDAMAMFVQLPQDIKTSVEITEKIRFMRTAFVVPAGYQELQSLMDHLMMETKTSILTGFVREKICQKAVQKFFQVWDGGNQQEMQIVARRAWTFFSEYFEIFIPSHNPNLKLKIIEIFLNSGALDVVKTLIKHGHCEVIQLLHFLVLEKSTNFQSIYFEEITERPLESMHAIICNEFSNSDNSIIVGEAINFWASWSTLFEGSSELFRIFNRSLLPRVFKDIQKYPMRLVPLITMYIYKFNELGVLVPYIISSELFSILAGKLGRKELRKQDMVDILMIIRCNIMTYCKFYFDFRVHEGSVQSLRSFLPKKSPTDRQLNARKQFTQLSNNIINSGILRLFLSYLRANLSHNNMVNSSILSCIQLMTLPMKYNPYIKEVREYDFELTQAMEDTSNGKLIKKYQSKLKKLDVPPSPKEDYNKSKNSHHKHLESQMEEIYLMKDEAEAEDPTTNGSSNKFLTQESKNNRSSNNSDLEEELIKMRDSMRRERENSDQINQIGQPDKKVKKDETPPVEFTFEFSEDMGEE